MPNPFDPIQHLAREMPADLGTGSCDWPDIFWWLR
jgi:hypothetical protein